MRNNDIRLYTEIDGELVSHFKLYEFQNKEELVMVHPSMLLSLEYIHRDLRATYGPKAAVIITGGIRTKEDLNNLASRLGWIDEGGLVSRTSSHCNGDGVDFKAKANGAPIPQSELSLISKKYFKFVKDDYADGHIHGDNRIGK